MDLVATGFGIVGVIPQCISSAKDLYDLRERFKDASVLITAIYSESMIIAASLSQLQRLLQQNALEDNPVLRDTFDQALTGCRVVYVCLDEEVRELAHKANSDTLKSKDRIKYLWKEDTFKDLLQQIRGQQSALSLLLQGLQMESIADIKKLVQDNSARLDQIATRSNTLRITHPTIKVPNSVFASGSKPGSIMDANTLLGSAEFDFDNEIVNSVAYRRAMAIANPKIQGNEHDTVADEEETNEKRHDQDPAGSVDIASLGLEPKPALGEKHGDLLDHLEQILLPFMPAASTVSGAFSPAYPMPPTTLSIASDAQEEMPPPLPPRRPTQASAAPKVPEASIEMSSSLLSDDRNSVFSTPSALSKISNSLSNTSLASSLNNPPRDRALLRKPLAVTCKASYDTIFRTLSDPEDIRLATSSDVEMHNVWNSLINEERIFVDRMTKFRIMFYDPVIKKWPVLGNHLGAIALGEQLAALNRVQLIDPMETQIAQKSFAICDPTVIEDWANKAQKLFKEYCQRLPHDKGALHMTQNMDPEFSLFIATLGLDVLYYGMSWEGFLASPVSQLDHYLEALRCLVKIALTISSPWASPNARRLMRAFDAVQKLKRSCLRIIEEAQALEDIQNLHRRIQTLNANYLSQLNLSGPGRRILAQGNLAIKIKGQGSWHAVYAVLIDTHLFWGEVKAPRSQKNLPRKIRRVGNIWILEAPIPLEEAGIRLPDFDHQFQKATILDDIPRGSVLYPIFIRDKASTAQPHMLGSSTVDERDRWASQLHAAIAARACIFPTRGQHAQQHYATKPSNLQPQHRWP
ncbi:hypothetical protein K504DRAFT_421967 [Pleomassaria siparia CBS 279.74]|uniref:PH domain-containing protein n=1 Tax=Pleomassaria siparia CBS 279.74 TaxID=1314801 RepID=A0A6G1KRY5_9PLEO|nr:hypothetical protein K504DRAFT_421967 [Pleomassaria siparia CBS 279.74]